MARRKSLFQIKRDYDDKRYPWKVTMQGIGVTHYLTKAEAQKKVKAARKKEKSLIKNF